MKATDSINLHTRAVELLRKLVVVLPQSQEFIITVFGFAPIQICVDSIIGAGVDATLELEQFREWVKRAGLSRNQTEFYIQVSTELNFCTSPRWKDRINSARINNCTFNFPHPIDILIAKLNRMEEKDFKAFRVYIAKTGHPNETELIHELQMAVDLFRPPFEEEQGHDLANNCRRLWRLIYGREIDPRQEIIAPALAIRKAGFAERTSDYKQKLRDK